MLTAMRQLMNFIVSVGLICAGLYVLYEELFVRFSGIHGRYGPFGVGLVLIGSGVVRLWFYCLGPIVLKKILESRDDADGSPTDPGGGKRRIIKRALIVIGLGPKATRSRRSQQ
jgi:hypothetical protein